MGAISAAREATSAVIRNPLLMVVMLFAGIAQIPSLTVQFANSGTVLIVGGIISVVFLLLVPFFYGGVIGMAADALNGKTDLRTFLHEGRDNYLRIFGAYVLFFVAMVAFVIVLSLIGGIGGIAAISLGQAGGGTGTGVASLLAVIVVPLVVFVLFVAFVFFLQFFGQAIVLDDRGVIGGFKGSIDAVRGNKLSTLGYMVVVMLFSMVFSVIGALIGALPALVGANDVLVVGGVLVVVLVVVTGVFGAFTATYGVAFYRHISAPVK